MRTNKKRASLQSILIVPNTRFPTLILLLLRKLPAKGTQLILIDYYLREKPTGPHNFVHLVPTDLTKDVNSDPKIASAIIRN